MGSQTRFASATPLAQAREQLLELCSPHERTVTSPVVDATGRVLTEPVFAQRDVPHYDRAAMDGYAVHAGNTHDASDRSPASLSETAPPVGDTEAVQVHTGSNIPEGADAVVMVEHTEQRDDSILVFDSLAAGENVAPAGEDVTDGTRLFDAGHRLSAADIGLLRSTGVHTVPVLERPRVSVVPTGDELVEEDPAPGEVVETNGMMVTALTRQWGGTPSYRDIVPDDMEALRTALEHDCDHDLLVTTGGSSVGERDLVADIVADMGTLSVHEVAIKPGHPVGFGVVGGTPIILLPGYPVSCLLNAVLFVRPAIAALGGWDAPSLPTVGARLTDKLSSKLGVRGFPRVELDTEADETDGTASPQRGEYTATPVRSPGASALSSIAHADGWVTIPEQSEGIPAGEQVTVTQWDWEWRP